MKNTIEDTGGAAAKFVAPRIAFAVSTAVYLGYALNAFVYVLVGGGSTGLVVLAAVLLLVLWGLQAGLLGLEIFRRTFTAGYLVLLLQALIAYLPLPLFGWVWLGTPAFLAGSVLLVVRAQVVRWAVFAAICLLSGVLMSRLDVDQIEAVYVVLLTAGNGVVVYGLARLNGIADRLRQAQRELAEQSVREERDRMLGEIQVAVGRGIEVLAVVGARAHQLAAGGEAAAAVAERMVRLARETLGRVRSVARSLRGTSLVDEIAAVRAVLSSAGMDVRVEGADTDPGAAEPELVEGLRALVDDLLRHEEVSRCDVVLDRVGEAVRLRVTHDGYLPPGAPATRSAGSPAAHVDRDADGLRRVELNVPHTAGSPGAAGPWAVVASRPMPLGAPQWMLGVLLVTQLCIAVLWLGRYGPGPYWLMAVVVCGLGMVLAGGMQRWITRRRSGWVTGSLLAAQTVLVGVLLLLTGVAQAGLVGLVGGGALLALRKPWNRLAFAVAVLAAAVNEALVDGRLVMVAYGIVASVNIGLSMYGLTRLGTLVAGLHDARAALTRTAVSRERSRVARDLHDLLSYSLSAIALKTELAVRLLGAGERERATQELADVRGVLRQASDDLATVWDGERVLTVRDELSSVCSVLSTAGVTLDVHGELGELPDGPETDLAMFLREAVNNMLRHADATTCRITLEPGPDTVVLSVANDGARAGAHTRSDGGGSGIANLTARIGRRGGTTTVDAESPGWFRLTARLPLGDARPVLPVACRASEADGPASIPPQMI